MHNFYIPKASPSSPSSAGTTTKIKGATKSDDSENSEATNDQPSPFEDLTTFRVFGMTARILVDAARVAYGEEPDFEHNSHFGDEDMIARLLKMGRLGEIRRKGDGLTKEMLSAASKM